MSSLSMMVNARRHALPSLRVSQRPRVFLNTKTENTEEEPDNSTAATDNIEVKVEAPREVEIIPAATQQQNLHLFGFLPVEAGRRHPEFGLNDKVIVPHLGSAVCEIIENAFNPYDENIIYLVNILADDGSVRSWHIIRERDILKPAAGVQERFRLGYHGVERTVERITVVNRDVVDGAYQYHVLYSRGNITQIRSEEFMRQIVELKLSMLQIRRRARNRRQEHSRLRARQVEDARWRREQEQELSELTAQVAWLEEQD